MVIGADGEPHEPVSDRVDTEDSSREIAAARSPADDVRARAFDVAAVLTTVGILITLAQLSAWRAVFSSVAAVGFAALLFAVRYLRGRWKIAVCAVLTVLSLGALVTVYLEPVFAGARSPRPGVAPSPGPSPLRVAMDALLPGDCVAGNDLVLENSEVPWPDSTQVVPCDAPHDGEVIMATDAWAAGDAFPGGETVDDQADQRCRDTFRAYVGVDYSRSVLDFAYGVPSATAWESGDRHMYCVVFDPKGTLTATVRRTGR